MAYREIHGAKMTIHSFVHYDCESCSTGFVPMETYPNCPKCSHKSPVVFKDFIEDTLGSASYNTFMSGSFMPVAWSVSGSGDYYYHIAFSFLAYVSKALGLKGIELYKKNHLSEGEALELTEQFLNSLNFGDNPYMAPAIRDYLFNLLLRLKDEASRARSK